ncbi:MAG: phosphatase PAP2 family protein [Candidatus Parvarchaeota archaeon]|nr:phosphatase PAP2 family protein [Candidatus Parvarchaeota archaeon]
MKSLEYISLLIEEYYVEIFILESIIVWMLEPTFRYIFLVVSSIALSMTLSLFFRVVIKSRRPAEALKRKYLTHSKLGKRSFPSEHAAVSFSFVGVFFGSYILIPVLLFALFVSYSRLYVKAHYLRDVIAGALIGLSSGLLVANIGYLLALI